MSWIPCPACHCAPCRCQLPPWQPWIVTVPVEHCQCCKCKPKCDEPKLASFSQTGHTLTDADVERVARRVVELLAEKLK